MSTKECEGFFLFCLYLELLIEVVKNERIEARCFLTFANNSRSKQNKKNRTHPFVDIGKRVRSFSKKILNCRVVEAR